MRNQRYILSSFAFSVVDPQVWETTLNQALKPLFPGTGPSEALSRVVEVAGLGPLCLEEVGGMKEWKTKCITQDFRFRFQELLCRLDGGRVV